MKTIIILLCMLSFALRGTAQNELPTINNEEVSPPKFTATLQTSAERATEHTLLQEYLRDNIDLEQVPCQRLKEGTEVVRITVAPSGNVSDIEIVSSVCPQIDKEIIRVLKTTDGMWEPGYKSSEPIAAEKEIMLAFRSNNDLIGTECNHYFKEKAALYYALGAKKMFTKDNHKKALYLFSKGIRYCPNDKNLLFMRGLCSFMLGNIDEAKSDWYRYTKLGGDLSSAIDKRDLTQMGDYDEMRQIFAEIKD